MMKCSECYWSAPNAATGHERVCCNKDSERYNEIIPEEEAARAGCERGESEQAVDYRTMTPWQFACKYYM